MRHFKLQTGLISKAKMVKLLFLRNNFYLLSKQTYVYNLPEISKFSMFNFTVLPENIFTGFVAKTVNK